MDSLTQEALASGTPNLVEGEMKNLTEREQLNEPADCSEP